MRNSVVRAALHPPTRLASGPLTHRLARRATVLGLRGDQRLWRLAERFSPVPPTAELASGTRRLPFDLTDPTFGEWIYRGNYERYSLAILRELVRPGWTTVDVGANQGLYSLAFSAWVGAEGSVVSVEPNPRLSARLDELASALPNVTAVKAAIGARPGVATFAPHDEAPGLARLVDDEDPGSEDTPTIQVPVETLATVVQSLDRPVDLIKIDVEGHETPILEQIAALDVVPLCVIVEVWSSQADDATREAIGALQARGLEPYEVGRAQGPLMNRPGVKRARVDQIGRDVQGNILLSRLPLAEHPGPLLYGD